MLMARIRCGTTLRACAELNRSCYGFEVDKEFYRKAHEVIYPKGFQGVTRKAEDKAEGVAETVNLMLF